MDKQHQSMDDLPLIDRLKQRNKEAFKLLFDKYAIGIYGLILDIVANPASASQILQQTFQTAYHTIEAYDQHKHQLFIWLLHIARSNAIELLRTNDQWPETDLSTKENGMYSLLRHLTTDQRQVFELMYYKGHSKQQVGQILNLSPETIANQFTAGMHLIRQHLNKIQQSRY